MPKIYFYKLRVDDGGAPCVENGLLSLAICKPMIRSTACKDDIVIGFAANRLHSDNRLIYVARITEPKLTNGNSFKLPQYASRADCIYEWRGVRYAVRMGAKYLEVILKMILVPILPIDEPTRSYPEPFAFLAWQGQMLTSAVFQPWLRL